MTRLEAERRRRGWTQTDLATFVGVGSKAAVSRWERGTRRPLEATARRLEALFKLRIDQLLEDEATAARAAAVV